MKLKTKTENKQTNKPHDKSAQNQTFWSLATALSIYSMYIGTLMFIDIDNLTHMSLTIIVHLYLLLCILFLFSDFHVAFPKSNNFKAVLGIIQGFHY